jgi:hypothetical protein
LVSLDPSTYGAFPAVPVNSLLMQKSSGTYELAVWVEPFLWNSNTRMEITPSPQSIPVQFKTLWTTVNIYDPMVGAAPVSTLHSVNSATLTLVDHPIIVELVP